MLGVRKRRETICEVRKNPMGSDGGRWRGGEGGICNEPVNIQLAQVLKAANGSKTDSAERVDGEAALFSTTKQTCFYKHRNSNKEHALALDYQLRVCPDVGGLQWFGMPAPIGQPGPDERRYFVAIEDFDASIRRYGVEWGTDRPSLWNCLDGAAKWLASQDSLVLRQRWSPWS